VDDGSTDGSGEICDKIAENDSRLKVFHVKNGGVTAARWYGAEHSSGEYLMFVDSDDGLLPGAISRLYEEIEKTKADEVIAGFKSDKGRVVVAPWGGFVNTELLISELLATHNTFCVMWAIIFRRGLLDGCFDIPREVIEGEDIATQINVLAKNPKAFLLQEAVYLYREDVPNDRKPGYACIKGWHDVVEKALRPQMDKYEQLFRLHQAKSYESYLERGGDDPKLKAYFEPLRSWKGSRGIPYKDRIILLLPPAIGRWIVRKYRKSRR